MSEFHQWNSANPCPACGGWLRAGKSSSQCFGGYVPERNPREAWCSVKPSPSPSSTGKTWSWSLDRDYPWSGPVESREESTSWRNYWVGDVRRDGYHGLPHRLRHHGLGWKIRLGPWIYRTAGGAYAYEAVRFDWQPDDHRPPPKGFEDGKTYSPLVRTSDGSHFGRWSQPEPRILYRLPELRAGIEQGRRVWIVEGEKSAEALVALGEVATCNPGGALSWPAVDFHALAGAREVLAAVDRDERGARWAADVVATLAKLEIRPRLLQSATTEKGDDVADHLEAGFGLGDLKEFTA